MQGVIWFTVLQLEVFSCNAKFLRLPVPIITWQLITCKPVHFSRISLACLHLKNSTSLVLEQILLHFIFISISFTRFRDWKWSKLFNVTSHWEYFFSFETLSPPSLFNDRKFCPWGNIRVTEEVQRNFRPDLWPCPLTMARATPRWNSSHSNPRLHSEGHRVYIREATLLCPISFTVYYKTRATLCMWAGPPYRFLTPPLTHRLSELSDSPPPKILSPSAREFYNFQNWKIYYTSCCYTTLKASSKPPIVYF